MIPHPLTEDLLEEHPPPGPQSHQDWFSEKKSNMCLQSTPPVSPILKYCSTEWCLMQCPYPQTLVGRVSSSTEICMMTRTLWTSQQSLCYNTNMAPCLYVSVTRQCASGSQPPSHALRFIYDVPVNSLKSFIPSDFTVAAPSLRAAAWLCCRLQTLLSLGQLPASTELFLLVQWTPCSPLVTVLEGDSQSGRQLLASLQSVLLW